MMRRLLTALAIVVADSLLSPRRSRPDTIRPMLKPFLWAAAILLVLGTMGGAVFVLSGIYPIAASSDHWPITRWVIELVKRRSVATHSLGADVPRLDDPAQVLKGAGHFEGGCRPCHGAPGGPLPVILQQMTPPPPRLADVVATEYDAAELFFVVKHGLKLTGMPAWPAQQRDDEVWAVVAFLRQLPGLDAEGYLRLVRDDDQGVSALTALSGPAPPEVAVQVCARCHGADGGGRGGAFPKLSGQHAEYIHASLVAYATGERHSGIMQPIAAALSDRTMREVADYYSRLEGLADPMQSNELGHGRGESIALTGIAGQDVPSCADCHGPAVTPRNARYPRLAGQHSEYLALQLRLLKAERRGGTSYVRLMHEVAPRLTEDQIRDVARYYAALGS